MLILRLYRLCFIFSKLCYKLWKNCDRSILILYVAPTCAGSDHSRSYVRNIFLHFFKRLFPRLEPMTVTRQQLYRCARGRVGPLWVLCTQHFPTFLQDLELMTSWSQGNSFTAVPEEGSDHFWSYVRNSPAFLQEAISRT
jgi:hypothetical protein